MILAEIGPSVESWPSAKKLASWACVCPGNNESVGRPQWSRHAWRSVLYYTQ
ncbi:transposase [Chloroflexi bacterium TSY]|nr:transposase [Chloroflexi bacterium TSY]